MLVDVLLMHSLVGVVVDGGATAAVVGVMYRIL